MTKENPLIGKKINAVYIATDKKAIRFNVIDSDPIIARVDGDCCSSTWIESVDDPEALLGTVKSIEDIPMPELPYDKDSYECIAFYGCKIITDKGVSIIDYRNESNGYYGGSLVWPNEGYYYGGVYGQNNSTMEFKDPIASIK